jgi:hypothetical protein
MMYMYIMFIYLIKLRGYSIHAVLHLNVYILVNSQFCLPSSTMCSVQKFTAANVLPHRGVRVWHMISVPITAGIYPICSL